MSTAKYQKLDSHLPIHDYDSLDWNEGLEYEVAVELLLSFGDDEWSQLSEVWRNKKRLWRGCLINCLSPDQGLDAQYLLIAAVEDTDPEIAFIALNQISFYCGVNDGPQGPFEDVRIRSSEFKKRVSGANNMRENILNTCKEVRSSSCG